MSLQNLPTERLLDIIKELPAKDMLSMCATNKTYLGICQNHAKELYVNLLKRESLPTFMSVGDNKEDAKKLYVLLNLSKRNKIDLDTFFNPKRHYEFIDKILEEYDQKQTKWVLLKLFRNDIKWYKNNLLNDLYNSHSPSSIKDILTILPSPSNPDENVVLLNLYFILRVSPSTRTLRKILMDKISDKYKFKFTKIKDTDIDLIRMCPLKFFKLLSPDNSYENLGKLLDIPLDSEIKQTILNVIIEKSKTM